MAVVTLGNLAPDTLPRIRGKFLVMPWRGIWVARAWPRKRGKPTNRKIVFTSQQFALAGRMAANSEPMQYATAVFQTAGSHWLPRDLLTMAAYGKAYEVYLPDGTKCTQADHGPPPEVQPARPSVLNWQPNQVSGVFAAANQATAAAFKGSRFTPEVSLHLQGYGTKLTTVAGGTYKALVAALNGSNQITAIQAGTPRTFSGAATNYYEFDIDAVLVAGLAYVVLFGRTNGANNYALPVPFTNNVNHLFPCTQFGLATLAQATPAVGQTVTIPGAAPPCMNLLLDF